MSLTTEHKERLVAMFLRGESVTDISAFYAVQRRVVENVLREAIHGLSKLISSAQPASRILTTGEWVCICGELVNGIRLVCEKCGHHRANVRHDTNEPAKEQQV